MKLLVRKFVYDRIMMSLEGEELGRLRERLLSILSGYGDVPRVSELVGEMKKSLLDPAYESVILKARAGLVARRVTATNRKTGKTYQTTVWVKPDRQNGLKRYTKQDSAGAKAAIRILRGKIAACGTPEELLELVRRNKGRFSDERGRPLPVVKELRELVEERKRKLGGKKPDNEGNEQSKKQKIFGKNYSDFSHRKKEAIDKLISEKQGYVEAAFTKDGIGDIDVVFGKVTDEKKHKGYGLAHILDKHPDITSEIMAEVLEKGSVKKTHNGYNIDYGEYILGVNKGFKEKNSGKYITQGNWVVTSFKKDRSRGTGTRASAASSTSKTTGLDNPASSSSSVPPKSDSVKGIEEKLLLW